VRADAVQKQVDILVNAAGITHASTLFTTTPDLLEEVVQTNLIGTMIACRTVGRNMIAEKGGKYLFALEC